MKLDLEALKYLYDYLEEKGDKNIFCEDCEEENIDFNDLKQYVINTIIDNLEYDLGINFSDYVDLNRFIIDE